MILSRIFPASCGTSVTVIRGSLALCDRIFTEPLQEVEDYHRQIKVGRKLCSAVADQRSAELSRLQNTDFPIEKEPVNLCDVV